MSKSSRPFDVDALWALDRIGEPSLSPDGAQAVASVTRYDMEANKAQSSLWLFSTLGGEPRRLTEAGEKDGQPQWSPRGDLIAFTRINSGTFSIGVMRPDGSGERILTESFLVEGPTWAPNGRVLMYFRQQPSDDQGRGGSVKLFSIDLTGFNEREIITPVDGSDPAWSPLIP